MIDPVCPMINEKNDESARLVMGTVNRGRRKKLVARNFMPCVGSKLGLALGYNYVMAGSTILRVENGLRRYYLG
ncbi:hypothetical protein DDT54_19285 [Brenneria nigrifluens DSM 30175 = ATCC 13028]|uniref:Uncharacterized protein n=1 Tax=Brenneria nigrifluens DSM 30175 = ATCC 13028 TaxID=1121120 RepID=A0A2U1UII9_9GAMM|nr:hypothetical protein DDT54_19285 [Brenneria nigrifluens DSM 30175 = ATCC 13028]